MLPEDHLLTDESLAWFTSHQTIKRYNNWYGVEYDGGKLMNAFLDFVKNNRYKDKCKMLFIYGGNDPCVKKHIVPNGVHSGWLNFPSTYPVAEKDWIMNAVKEMLQ